MKKTTLFILALVGSFIINSCKKEGGQNNSNNNNNKDTTKTTPPVVLPIVTITQTPLTVLLPNNCQQSFTISNTGPSGSTLDYTVADDGALGGFLNFSNGTGSLAAGASVTVLVSVKPAFVNSKPSLVGASLVLDVYTPKASNLTKAVVPVRIKSISSITLSFIGTTWSGTWTGKSYGRNNPMEAQPSSPVSGTWTLNIKTIDTVGMTATGTLTWNGTDAYWTYIVDKNGIITMATAHPFIPDRTIQFDASNTVFAYDAAGTGCVQSQIHLTITGFAGKPNPSDAFYGPYFNADLDISTNTVFTVGVGFSAHPYAPVTFDTNVSSGTVDGKKQ